MYNETCDNKNYSFNIDSLSPYKLNPAHIYFTYLSNQKIYPLYFKYKKFTL